MGGYEDLSGSFGREEVVQKGLTRYKEDTRATELNDEVSLDQTGEGILLQYSKFQETLNT